MIELAPAAVRGSQRPRLLHLPSGTPVQVDDALYLLGEWGMELDDWQRFVLRGALLERRPGQWSALELGLEVPRQNGKGELLEARGLLGLFLLDERLLIHSAHEFSTALEALERMDERIAQNPQLKRLCNPTKRSHGEEGIYRKDRSCRLRYKTRTKKGGRGFTADWLALDEAMFIAEAFHGSLLPTVSAVPNPQIWYTGSAVDQEEMEDGVVFARVRDRAIRGDDDRLAFFGWSPPFDHPDDVPSEQARDPELWAQGNPALSIRIDPEHVALEQRSMSHRKFCIERLGVGDWPSVDEGAEDEFVRGWATCVDAESAAVDPVCFAFDSTPDYSASSIGVAGNRSDGLRHLEMVDHRPGTDWVAERIAELAGRHVTGSIKYGSSSPAAALAPAVQRALAVKGVRVKLEAVSSTEHAQAYGALLDGVMHQTLRHRGQPELAKAVRGAVTRPAGDATLWSRKSSNVDISPLVSVTLAGWGVESAAQKSREAIFF